MLPRANPDRVVRVNVDVTTPKVLLRQLAIRQLAPPPLRPKKPVIAPRPCS